VPVQGSYNYNLNVEFTDVCPVDPQYKGDLDPLDLAEIYKPHPIRYQRELLKFDGEITNARAETEPYAGSK
jgi:hypothetical protein